MNTAVPLETLSFSSASDFKDWLHKNHNVSPGFWLKLFKKNSGVSSVSYLEAVEVSLCYGWIDSQVKGLDEQAYLQKFSPRRSKSIWSKINTARAEKLIAEKKMQPAGLAEIEKAKADGRWEKAYHPPSSMKVPDDFLKELNKNNKAKKFFEQLNKTNLYAIAWKIETSKTPETRQKRIRTLIELLESEKKLHP